MAVTDLRANHALEPTAASGLRRLAVPSSLRSSAAAQRERYAASDARLRSSPDDRHRPSGSSRDFLIADIGAS